MDAVTSTPRFAEAIGGHGWEAYCAAVRVDCAKPLSLVSPALAKTTSPQQKAKDADRNR
jgi:hypothetical protein